MSKFLDDINNNCIELPTLPEIAFRIREIVQNPHSSAAKIAITIGADPAITAKLLQVANSPLYHPNKPIQNLQTAIAWLGQTVVRNIVTGMVMQQIYQQGNNKETKKHLKKLWLHSTKVAAISYVLARRFPPLQSDVAMLAGLIHDIGAIPVYIEAANNPALKDEGLLQNIVAKMHNLIGTTILDNWNFPQEMIDVVANHENLEYDSGKDIDYVDIVTVANILSYVGSPHPLAKTDWAAIPAFKKLGLTPEESIATMEEAQIDVALVQNMFV